MIIVCFGCPFVGLQKVYDECSPDSDHRSTNNKARVDPCLNRTTKIHVPRISKHALSSLCPRSRDWLSTFVLARKRGGLHHHHHPSQLYHAKRNFSNVLPLVSTVNQSHSSFFLFFPSFFPRWDRRFYMNSSVSAELCQIGFSDHLPYAINFGELCTCARTRRWSFFSCCTYAKYYTFGPHPVPDYHQPQWPSSLETLKDWGEGTATPCNSHMNWPSSRICAGETLSVMTKLSL